MCCVFIVSVAGDILGCECMPYGNTKKKSDELVAAC